MRQARLHRTYSSLIESSNADKSPIAKHTPHTYPATDERKARASTRNRATRRLLVTTPSHCEPKAVIACASPPAVDHNVASGCPKAFGRIHRIDITALSPNFGTRLMNGKISLASMQSAYGGAVEPAAGDVLQVGTWRFLSGGGGDGKLRRRYWQ